MEVKDYLFNRIKTCSHYTLSDEDKKFLETKGIEEFIFRKLTSKKFRKWSQTDTAREALRAVIKYCVSQKKRIRLDFSFGGFKLWRLPTAPEVDWSELFSIAYVCEYVAPILAVYEPGIFIDFSSADIAVTAVNNVPKADVDRYNESFKTLLKTFEVYFPSNLKIDITRLRDLFADEKELIAAVQPYLPQFRKELDANPQYKDELKRGAVQNMQTVDGVEDLSKLSDEEMQKRLKASSEVAEGLYYTPPVVQKNGDDSVWLLATKLVFDAPCVIIGTTKRSTAKFWAGMGVLAREGNSFGDYVITPKQWEQTKDRPHETATVDFVPLKNFKENLIYPEKLDFSKR